MFGEACGVLLLPAASRSDDDAPRPGERFDEFAAGAGHVYDDDLARGQTLDQLGVIGGGQIIPPAKIDRRVLSVEAAVADEEDEDLVVGFDRIAEPAERFSNRLG